MAIEKDEGYGKPPKRWQFKKGQSGNPKGRPKGSTTVASAYAKILNQKVRVNDVTMTMLEAILNQAVVKAARGDMKALKEVIAFGKYLRLIEPVPEAKEVEPIRVLVVPEALSMDRWMEVYGKKMAEKQAEAISNDHPRLAPLGPAAIRNRSGNNPR